MYKMTVDDGETTKVFQKLKKVKIEITQQINKITNMCNGSMSQLQRIMKYIVFTGTLP